MYQSKIERCVSLIGCAVSEWPMKYSSMPLGAILCLVVFGMEWLTNRQKIRWVEESLYF